MLKDWKTPENGHFLPRALTATSDDASTHSHYLDANALYQVILKYPIYLEVLLLRVYKYHVMWVNKQMGEKHMQFHSLPWIMAIACIFVAAGCSDNGSSSSTDGKWLEAPAALTIYLANTELIMSGRDKEGCPVVIEDVREGLNDPEMYGTQALLKQCSDAGMEFGEEVRCKEKRLQVKCL